jgi:hypothetical protein
VNFILFKFHKGGYEMIDSSMVDGGWFEFLGMVFISGNGGVIWSACLPFLLKLLNWKYIFSQIGYVGHLCM